MIKVSIKEPSSPDWPAPNPYVAALDEWKFWASNLGLTYVPSGSERSSLEPGQWCVQSYSRDLGRIFPGRQICFHESDRDMAILFKLIYA